MLSSYEIWSIIHCFLKINMVLLSLIKTVFFIIFWYMTYILNHTMLIMIHRLSMKHLESPTSHLVYSARHWKISRSKVCSCQFLTQKSLRFLFPKCSFQLIHWEISRIHRPSWLDSYACYPRYSVKSWYIQGSSYIQPMALEGTAPFPKSNLNIDSIYHNVNRIMLL